MRLDLYNNVNQEKILAAIGLTEGDIPRPRGCGIEDGMIIVHTRTGGGNRESYEEENDKLTENEYYLRDEDDDFDSTYANWYFRVPEEFQSELLKLEDPVMKAAFGDAKDYITAFIGGDAEAAKRIQARIDKAMKEAKK